MSILQNEEFKNRQPRIHNKLSKIFYDGHKNGALDAEEILTKQFEQNEKQTACEFAEYILDALISNKIEVDMDGDSNWITLKRGNIVSISTEELYQLYLKEKSK